MKRAPLLVLVVTLVIVGGVGVELAASHQTRDQVSTPAPAPADPASGAVAAPSFQGDVAPDQPAAKDASTAKPKPSPPPKKHAASQPATTTNGGSTTARSSTRGDEQNCWDDCGTSGSGSVSPVGIDDDGDGDGGDCGEGD